MRTIKFRGKRLDNGEWVHGDLITKCNPYAIVTGNNNPFSPVMHTCEVDRETVGQFTGMHDMNGREIYEGDILRFHGDLYIVRYLNGCYIAHRGKYYNSYPLGYIRALTKIVGNIHDKPDALIMQET